ncbi:MAG: hypothetical protein EOO03_01635 [Chitinophagaceae bacterium]|nr:MAG: hypothetical protein EOO03_01635 [Chitinophagaceae bacterium]
MKRYILSFVTLLAVQVSIAQNVGIGTNQPLHPLTVKTLSGNLGMAHTNDTVTLATKVGKQVVDIPFSYGMDGGWLGTRSNHPLYLFTNNGNRQVAFKTNFETEFLGQRPALTFYDNGQYAGQLRSFGRNIALNSMPYDFGDGIAPGTLYLQTGDWPYNGNIAIGDSSPNFKVTIAHPVLSNNQTLLLKLKGTNPVMTFEEGAQRYGYITAKSQTPAAPFTRGLLIGAEAGYPIMFSTNNYGLSMIVANNGNVGIGTSNPTYKLSVNGNVRSKEVIVESGWADYVFEDNYPLLSLKETEQFILQNKHLPGIPSAKEIQQNGLSVGELQTKMMAKIEELTLHIIELEKKMEALQKQPIADAKTGLKNGLQP